MILRVRVRFASPAVLNVNGDLPTLDSVLAALRARELGLQRASPLVDVPVPLQQTEGVYHASALWPVGDFLIDYEVMPRKLDLRRAEELRRKHGAPGATKINVGSGPTTQRMTTVSTVLMREGEWVCATDEPNRVAALLSRLRHVGGDRSRARGLVTDIVIREAGADESVVDRRGVLRRPVPLRLAEAFGLDGDHPDRHRAYLAFAGYRPPYWLASSQDLCLVPVPIGSVERQQAAARRPGA